MGTETEILEILYGIADHTGIPAALAARCRQDLSLEESWQCAEALVAYLPPAHPAADASEHLAAAASDLLQSKSKVQYHLAGYYRDLHAAAARVHVRKAIESLGG